MVRLLIKDVRKRAELIRRVWFLDRAAGGPLPSILRNVKTRRIKPISGSVREAPGNCRSEREPVENGQQRRRRCTVKMSVYPRTLILWRVFWGILTERVQYTFASVNRRNDEALDHIFLWARVSLFPRFTNTNLYRTGVVSNSSQCQITRIHAIARAPSRKVSYAGVCIFISWVRVRVRG